MNQLRNNVLQTNFYRDDLEVAIVYLRSLYVPEHFNSEKVTMETYYQLMNVY